MLVLVHKVDYGILLLSVTFLLLFLVRESSGRLAGALSFYFALVAVRTGLVDT